ncbi:DUF1120 domain-containing protein [Pseudomonas sp. PDM32]|uniref:DUF1120 domain-containing protein n=1 Tax=Pseudomonas sp. PDM32 TaxID=2854768 RepID=UPI001C46B165|nr:DUF1120 domain-containing protein [Pseudomonas sp. PDM32]MBV7572909.1 DUF1120 domain-containing protein [Pseudomonas sp. PDM32]
MNLSRFLLLAFTHLALSSLTPLAWALPDDCQLSLSQPVLDFGLMNRAIRLDTTPVRSLGERRLSLNLICSAPTDMSLFYRAMAATAERYHFAERGSYEVSVRDAVLDGQPVDLGLIASAGTSPVHTASSVIWRPEHGIVPVTSGLAVQGRSFSVQVEVTAWVQEQAMQVRDAVIWETSGVFDAIAAGRSRETTLRASFAPGACKPDLSNGGLVDFGRLSRNDLNPDKGTRLPPKSLSLQVNCDAPTHYALVMHDNRAGSATVNSEVYYGLGFDNGQNKIGLYSLNVDPADVSADHFTRLYRTDSTTAGAAWSPARSNPIPFGQKSYLAFTDTAGSTAGPVAIQHLNTMVTVEAVIAPTTSLDLSTAAHLDGSGTIEVFYL